eukprot:m.209946 g.209946  ORF g.209946 m.209946 type:complete len:219 (-) comp53954_c0_seq5:1291-1947(-)
MCILFDCLNVGLCRAPSHTLPRVIPRCTPALPAAQHAPALCVPCLTVQPTFSRCSNGGFWSTLTSACLTTPTNTPIPRRLLCAAAELHVGTAIPTFMLHVLCRGSQSWRDWLRWRAVLLWFSSSARSSVRLRSLNPARSLERVRLSLHHALSLNLYASACAMLAFDLVLLDSRVCCRFFFCFVSPFSLSLNHVRRRWDDLQRRMPLGGPDAGVNSRAL